MPSFKPKILKKIKSDTKINYLLDVKHNEFIHEFNKNDTDKKPKLIKELNLFENKLNSYKIGELKLTIEQLMEIKDTIIELKKKINILKKKRLNYYLDN